MAKGKKTGGRKPGSVNKTTASAKEALALAFEGLGGYTRLMEWANRDDKNLGSFFGLWSKLVPHDITTNGKDLMVPPPVINVLPPSAGE